jgi:hypothetical protein
VTAGMTVAGLALTGCGSQPLKMGAAAIVGNNAISVASLTNETYQLESSGKAYPGVYKLTSQEATQETLSWLIRFRVNDQLASKAGISVSPAASQAAFTSVYEETKSEAAQSGVANLSTWEFLVANGIPPNQQAELGLYLAINNAFLSAANGGSPPTSATSPAVTELTRSTCLAAKSLSIQVNPQFGVLNYTSYSVVNTPDTVSRASGTKKTASVAGLTPACLPGRTVPPDPRGLPAGGTVPPDPRG